jgi:hypothetical protein
MRSIPGPAWDCDDSCLQRGLAAALTQDVPWGSHPLAHIAGKKKLSIPESFFVIEDLIRYSSNKVRL